MGAVRRALEGLKVLCKWSLSDLSMSISLPGCAIVLNHQELRVLLGKWFSLWKTKAKQQQQQNKNTCTNFHKPSFYLLWSENTAFIIEIKIVLKFNITISALLTRRTTEITGKKNQNLDDY